jgi:ubiquinone biosynthesis monooxygenase Coq7
MNKKIAEIIRVNQAGEYGAKCIYEGQIAALKKFRDPDVEVIKHMYEQELEHLEYFNKELVDRKIRPTIMQPIWHFGSYALGYVSGKLGVKAAMACTEAVEEVIEKHYNDQILYLDKIKKAAPTEISWLAASKYSFIVIHEENLVKLKSKKDVETYKKLLNNQYPGKF